MVRMFSSSALWLSVVLAVGLPAASEAHSEHKVSTCKGDPNVVILHCEVGNITVTSARYGNDSQICPGLPVEDFCDCDDKADLAFFKLRCDGKTTCEMNSSLIKERDPCLDNYKYVEVEYSCNGEADSITSTVCQVSYIHLQCEDAEAKIFIESATWGRSDQTTCSFGRSDDELTNVNCSTDATIVMQSRCDNRDSCTVPAVASAMGADCPGTYLYLTVKHTCQRTVLACHLDPATLQCPPGEIIIVKAADYGRLDSSICAEDVPPFLVENTNCSSAPSTLLRLETMCRNQQSCSVTPYLVFRDLCLDAVKYFTASYICRHL